MIGTKQDDTTNLYKIDTKAQSERMLYLKHVILSSILHFILSALSYYLMEPFSHQSSLYSDFYFPYFANFDGFHFTDNNYTYLPNFAFLPSYNILVRSMIYVFGPFAFLVLSLINSTFSWFSALQMARICKHMNISEQNRKRCINMFIFNPAGVYYHSIYTQSIYFFLTLKFTSYVIQIPSNKMTQGIKQITTAVVLLMLAILIRSTALFLLPIIGIPILYQFINFLIKRKFNKAFNYFALGSLILLFTCSVFTFYLMWCHSRICNSERKLKECTQSIFFNVYSYVQDKYWNVGIFKYYNQLNIVFILIGMPSLIFSILMLRFPKNILDFSTQLSFWILLLIIILMTNLQSSTRFLSSHPSFYINAILWRQNCYHNCQTQEFSIKKGIWKLFNAWRIFYFFIGIILFTLQFPWT